VGHSKTPGGGAGEGEEGRETERTLWRQASGEASRVGGLDERGRGCEEEEPEELVSWC
jgi:hypothetical protein